MKILSTLYKEFLLLVRDPGGMALIFLMPLILVVVMALVQDAPFKDYQETKLDVILVDFDNDSLGDKVRQAFNTSPNVNPVEMQDTTLVRELIRAGEYKAAVILPNGASSTLRNKTRQMITNVFANFGLTAETDSSILPVIGIRILFDPAIKANYTQAISGSIEQIIANIQMEWILDELQSQLADGRDDIPKVKFDMASVIRVDQQDAVEGKLSDVTLNSVQHNVPAWTMFAMFFILFPLAGNFIKEREEGSMLRLRLIAGSQFPVIAGKFALYFLVCLAQFVLMVCVGLFIMPLLGLDKLVLGSNVAGILLTSSAVAMAATGYGTLIAVYFKTPQQALSFGSISVVILSALGGVWVPVYVMPEILQTISGFSPLNWGLESFNDLFLRGVSTTGILPNVLKLTGFSILTLSASVIIHKSRTVV